MEPIKHKPNLFIIGAPKCGTTTLHYILKQHPEIFIPNRKEFSFFATDLNKEIEKNKGKLYNVLSIRPKTEKKYLQFFKKGNNHKIIGDISPWSFNSKNNAKNIYNFNPKAKIIIILREPTALLQSIHSQLLYTNDENIKNFQQALKMESKRKKGISIPKYTTRPSILYYSSYIQYSKIINKYFQYFNKQNIKILILDDLKNNFNKTIKDIFNFLYINPNFTPIIKNLNTNKIPKIKFLHNPILKRIIAKLCPNRLQVPLSNLLKILNNKKITRPQLKIKFKEKLKKKYYNEVVNTEKILNRNLRELWKYKN